MEKAKKAKNRKPTHAPMRAYRLDHHSPKLGPRGGRASPAPFTSPSVARRAPRFVVTRAVSESKSSMEDSVASVAIGTVRLFVQRQNELDADGCATMLVDDAEAYGAVGRENVRNALRDWFERHPGLRYECHDFEVAVHSAAADDDDDDDDDEIDVSVTFSFERRCDDRERWGGGRETVWLDRSCRRVRRVEVEARPKSAEEGRRVPPG